MAASASIPISGSTRWASWLPWIALAFILYLGAELRFSWPLPPFADSDTWGYLHPALSALNGTGFRHTEGRNFVYPGWVFLLLRGSGDFRAISIAQHLLGLGTGALLWRVWNQWRACFRHPRLPAWCAHLAGLGLVAFYVSSTTAIHFEQRIRPEAIFPFFAVLEISLTLTFLHLWYVEQRHWRAAISGGAVVLGAILLYQLKPSFGLTVAVALAPLLAALMQPRVSWRDRLAPLAAATGGTVLAFALLLWPEHQLARADPMSTLFLPETLLTIHASMIRDQMTQDLANGDPTPYAREVLTVLHDRLDQELAVAATSGDLLYPSLGFNPDYLLYQDSYCRWLGQEIGSAAIPRLCFYYFERTWLHRPAIMIRNVARQLHTFYTRRCPAFWLGEEVNVQKNYLQTVHSFDFPSLHQQMEAWPPARAYLAASERAAAVPATYHQPRLFTRANRRAGKAHAHLLIAFAICLPLMLATCSADIRRDLALSGWLVLLFFAYTFGNCLTVAIVHSLDLDRYTSNLLIFTVLAEAAALVWCAEALLCALYQLNAKLYPVTSYPSTHASRQ